MNRIKNQGGFTLIELMVVIVIIGILATLAIPKFMGATNKAKFTEFKLVLRQAITLYNAYYQEHDTFITPTGNITNGNPEIGFDPPEEKSRFVFSSVESKEGIVVTARLKEPMGNYKAGDGADLNQNMEKNTVTKDLPW